uniref:Mobile element protein n=1 Tax=Klebsiella pneumoniae TaxID=573 RepID=A0A8B0SWA3_KLEPN|nr:Mobile element protein [Klebsiella pneumoniae]
MKLFLTEVSRKNRALYPRPEGRGFYGALDNRGLLAVPQKNKRYVYAL